MKRIVSIIYVFILLISTFGIKTFARESNTDLALNSIISDYISERGFTEYDINDYKIIFRDDNLILIHGAFGIPLEEMFTGEKFGDYYISASSRMSPYPLGYYVVYPKLNCMYNLRQAYDEKLSGVEELFENGYVGRRLGDANYDNKIDVQDVTAVQKYVAKIKVNFVGDYFYGGGFYISDFNGDNKIDISDATALQKYIAKLN